MLKISSEVQDYIRRQGALNPEQDISVLEHCGRVEIYSIGDDNGLYLTYEMEGGASRFARVKLCEAVKEFVVTNVTGTDMVAIAYCYGEEIKIAVARKPEILTPGDYKLVDFSGVLGGKKLVPDDLLLSSLNQGITLFAEMKDETGRIEQFSCLMKADDYGSMKYFPLASNFSAVYNNAAGCAVDQWVDGIYTYGKYGDTDQLLYTPSKNVFSKETAPAPIRLKATGRIDTICTLPLKKTTGTHLFAVGEKKLFFYPFDRQKDMNRVSNPDPDLKLVSDLFCEAKKVAAVHFDNQVYVYVLNEANVLSYTFAEYKAERLGDFVEPAVLMENVLYFDIGNDGTMNVCQENTSLIGVRNQVSGQWMFESACIQTELDTYTTNSAYVTRICTGTAMEAVRIKAKDSGKICCYINDVYHKFNEITVKTDVTGTVRIAQIASDLTPPCFTISCEVDGKEESRDVNPAEESEKRILSLTDVETLKAQVITDPLGNTRHLFGESPSQNDLEMIAGSFSALNGAITSFIPGFVGNPVNKFVNGIVVKCTGKLFEVLGLDEADDPFSKFVHTVVKDVAYAVDWVTDKINWLYDHTVAPIMEFAMKVVGKVWKFIVRVGEKVLEVVVDTVERVFSTAVKLLEMIGIPVDEIFDWLKKLLHIDDAIRMNDCMKKMIRLSSKKIVEGVAETKETVVKALDTAIDQISEWAKIDLSKINDDTKKYASFTPAQFGCDQSSRGMYMFETLSGAFDGRRVELPTFSVTDALKKSMDKFQECVKENASSIDESVNVFISLKDDLSKLMDVAHIYDVLETLKSILGKVAIMGLDVCKALIQCLFDIVICGLEAVTEIILQPVHIPLVSDILKIFGVKEFSLVDLVTFPTSFLATITSEIIKGKPLIDNELYDIIMSAESLEDVARGERRRMLKASANKTEHYLDQGKSKLVTAFKIVVGAFGIASVYMIAGYLFESDESSSLLLSPILGSIDFALSSLDFGFSLATSIIYSPMSEVGVVGSLSMPLDIIGYLKMASTAGGLVLAWSCYKFPNGKAINFINDKAKVVVDGVGNILTLVLESICVGAVAAYDVGNSAYEDASRGKKSYLCDNSGAIINDARSLVDGVYGVLKWFKQGLNPYVIAGYAILRTPLCIGYAGCMMGSAAIAASDG